MNVKFMRSTADPRSLNKQFTDIETVAAYNTRETMSLLYPEIITAYSSQLLAATHIFIADWGNRIYSINNINFGVGGKISFECAIDVLATYGSLIKECMCSVSRSENAGINWVPDDKFPLDTLHTVTKGESSVFTSPFIKDSSAPWVFTVINDNGAVHSTAQERRKKSDE